MQKPSNRVKTQSHYVVGTTQNFLLTSPLKLKIYCKTALLPPPPPPGPNLPVTLSSITWPKFWMTFHAFLVYFFLFNYKSIISIYLTIYLSIYLTIYLSRRPRSVPTMLGVPLSANKSRLEELLRSCTGFLFLSCRKWALYFALSVSPLVITIRSLITSIKGGGEDIVSSNIKHANGLNFIREMDVWESELKD